ncbi:hypothetical protein F3Y22_tig00110346pilonHSYRG00153 [Hibiscus syriacus]|uniref:RNase H type-1 domain-containing protein n=1 Tax=Hibiscus syriacus TaxID=106335 RepID=A0A6A3AUI7_HIBSY|nr:hypothetical protein F3Y22_tig00110346pilonHSYRG00153 [Hibiscus syriacus]
MKVPKSTCKEIEAHVRKFIWGGSSASNKVSLVNWGVLCQPLDHGGLDLRNIQGHNMAFTIKLGFRLGYCLNVDGATSVNTSISSIGGLIRDKDGNWLLGFSRRIGIVNAFQALLWAILTGMTLAWSHGFEIIQIQSDCDPAICLLQSPDVISSFFSFKKLLISVIVTGLWIFNGPQEKGINLPMH